MTVSNRPTTPTLVFQPVAGNTPQQPTYSLHETARVQADNKLAKSLGPHPFAHPHSGPGSLFNVPPRSTLGLWLTQLDKALRTPDFQRWMKANHISPSNVQFRPEQGSLDVFIHGKPKTFTLDDDSDFAAVAGPLLQAVEALGFWPPASGMFLYYPHKPYNVASADHILQFYGIRQGDTHGVDASARLQRFPAIPTTDELRGDAALADHQRSLDDSTAWVAPPPPSPAARAKAAYKQLLGDTYRALPHVRNEAKQWAEALIFKLTGRQVDADTIFFNRFNQAQSASTLTGWQHLSEEPKTSQRLPDALLGNFSEHDALPGVLDEEAGLYTAGLGQSKKGGYGAHNQFVLTPSQVMHESWKTDFQAHMTGTLERFWREHGDDYRATLKGEFVYQARQQLMAYDRASPAEREAMPAEQRFTQEDYRLVMGAASNLPQDEHQPLTVEQLKAQAPVEGVVLTHAFDINGRVASDILRFTADDGSYRQLRGRKDGVQVLYVPGQRPAFLRFDSLEKMDDWVAGQGKDIDKRKALESHFTLRDRQDDDLGFWSDVKSFITGDSQSNKGVDTGLAYLGNGNWDSIEGAAIDSANVRIYGDVFSVIKEATRHRMNSDAGVMIKSDKEVLLDTVLNDVTAAARLMTKFAAVGEPIVVGAAAATSLAQIVLGTQKALSGDTQAERKQGASAALDGALNTLFAIGGGAAEDPFEMPANIPLRQEVFADGTQGLVTDHPLTPTAYTLPRSNGYDLVDAGKVYRHLDANPGELTDLESLEHTRPLDNFEAFCPAPSAGGRVRRGVNDDCFVKLIEALPPSQAQSQALEHVRLFPSKAGLFKRARTVIYEKRLHTVLDTDTGAQLVPVANGKRILYKQQVRGKIINDAGFGFFAADSGSTLAKDTRVVKLNQISAMSNDQRQVRGVVVTSGSRQYLVVEADTAEFYYTPLTKAPTGELTFNKCGPFQLSLVQGYRQFLSAHHAVQALDTDFIALPPLKQAYTQLERAGFQKADIEELKTLCKDLNPAQQREVAYQLQRAKAITAPDIALRPHRVTPLQTPADFADWPALRQNRFYAEQAKVKVNQAFKATGLGPGNQLHSPADVARADAAALTLGWLRRTADLRASNAGDLIMKTGAGNCGEMALLSQDIINKSGGTATLWNASDAHSFTVIGGPSSKANPTVDFSEPAWADAWIIDPWADIACPAPEYTQQLQATMIRWDKAGWKIREGTRLDMSPLDRDWMDKLIKRPKHPQTWQTEAQTPRAARISLRQKPAATVHVSMGESTTLNTGNENLSTRSLTDCSALAVLSDWNGSTYQTRTLMHLTGSNLELGLRGGNTRALLDTLRTSLNKGGRVILVGGVNSDSLQGMATTIGQTFNGGQPLRELLRDRPGVTVTLASSLGVTVNADGTFELIEDSGKGVFTPDTVRQIFDRVD
ncbi:hypothetical protein BFW88_13470 [Pseudomonas fluorescens]|uniref:Dermonecrotic toxin N-terminal domain-containing protein n=2 Tax=Pseudomonas lactucae TaxID=2813360 RepID=A0A9X1C825_9PSED|nr:DUF6543 domain-containing protein [Pseudomonas lactucae]MBN2978398.1 hypothetical protein [Pseudomonas lactucae]OPA91151.1 hypothetical protein BFW88_13470 [Pseudomonas fluorescens]OPB09238.1 hypothetical protein BFW92_13665 [Pseudomonas fluorescens]OPB21085.1 hypothetical protein BFW93_13455 [Pseudomonas fluorescens]